MTISVEDHIKYATQWHIVDGQYEAIHLRKETRGVYQMSLSEIIQTEPLLEVLLPFLIDYWKKEYKSNTLPGDAIRLTLLHMSGQRVPFVKKGDNIYHVELITYFDGTFTNTGDNAVMFTHGLTKNVIPGAAKFGFANDVVPHVNKLGQIDIRLEPEWLDDYYPGWKQRYEAAKYMGMNDWGAADFVFTPQEPLTEVDLASIEFG